MATRWMVFRGHFSEAAQKEGSSAGAGAGEQFPGHDEMLAWNIMSLGLLGVSFRTGRQPQQVARAPRYGQRRVRGWSRDKTDNLQDAFFNGVGYESWENVWGIWNGITPRDARRFDALPRSSGSSSRFW